MLKQPSTHLQNVLSGAVDNVFWTEIISTIPGIEFS